MKKLFDRRLFLRGSGSILIGLPLVEELIGPAVGGGAAEIPQRVVTMSFGLGVEKALQQEGQNGPLEPLWNTKSKAAFFSNLKNDPIKFNGTVHFNVGATLFTGKKQPGLNNAGGPSLEQIVKDKLHPNGVPSVTGLPSKSAGIWSRTGAIAQYCRHWNQNGSPGELPERRPSKVFDDIFGSYTPPTPGDGEGQPPDPAAEVERRIKRSVLDTVTDQHAFLTGPRSFLGAESKARIDAHLTATRQVEVQLVPADAVAGMMDPAAVGMCEAPVKGNYTDPGGVDFYDAKSGAQGGPKVDWKAIQQAFRLSADLFALGLSCDALRFGSLIYIGAGEHLRPQGTYEAIGKSLNFTQTFDGRSPHDGIFHNYVQNSVRVYQHYVISQLGYALDRMDALMEPNGKTVLDNTLVVIGTEYGKNHDGGKDIFHAIVGGNGKFKPGDYAGNHGFNDVYSTVLKAYGIDGAINGQEIPGLVV